jgi:hypothetical protein
MLKRLSLFSLAVLLVATAAHAAVPISFTLSDAAGARVDRQRLRLNKRTCEGLGLLATCTQAEARAIDPAANVYSSHSDYIDRVLVKDWTTRLKGIDTDEDTKAFCAWFKAAAVAEQNAACALAALPNGCELCQ